MNSVKSRKFTVNLYLEGANVFFIGHNKHVASAMGFTLVPTGLFIVQIAVHRFVINMVRGRFHKALQLRSSPNRSHRKIALKIIRKLRWLYFRFHKGVLRRTFLAINLGLLTAHHTRIRRNANWFDLWPLPSFQLRKTFASDRVS